MIPEIIKDLITIVSVIAAIAFGYLAFAREKKHDDQGEAAQMAVLNANMGEVRGGVDEIKTKLERMDEKQDELRTELAQVKESTKQAHKRIDTLGIGGRQAVGG